MTPYVELLLRDLIADLPAMGDSLPHEAFNEAAQRRCLEIVELAPAYDRQQLNEVFEVLRRQYGW